MARREKFLLAAWFIKGPKAPASEKIAFFAKGIWPWNIFSRSYHEQTVNIWIQAGTEYLPAVLIDLLAANMFVFH